MGRSIGPGGRDRILELSRWRPPRLPRFRGTARIPRRIRAVVLPRAGAPDRSRTPLRESECDCSPGSPARDERSLSRVPICSPSYSYLAIHDSVGVSWRLAFDGAVEPRPGNAPLALDGCG